MYLQIAVAPRENFHKNAFNKMQLHSQKITLCEQALRDGRPVHTVWLRVQFLKISTDGLYGQLSVIVTIIPCEHLHWIQHNPLVAITKSQSQSHPVNRPGREKKRVTCQDRFPTGGAYLLTSPNVKLLQSPVRKGSQLKATINTVINAVLMFGDGERGYFLDTKLRNHGPTAARPIYLVDIY